MASVICGLYTGSETLSMIALRPAKKGWSVAGGAADFHAPGEETDLGPAVKALAKNLKLHKAAVTSVLPKQQAILRHVLLPSTDRDELVQMARFEAERHIPFHAERHSTGFHVMRSLGLEGSEVLLGAVDGPVVDRVLASLTAANLTPQGATLSSVALMNSLLHARREWVASKPVAIMSLGLDALDLVFVHEGRVLFARSVSVDLRSVLEGWVGYTAGESGAPRPDMAKLALAARMIDCTNLEGTYGVGGAPSHEVAERVRGWIDRVMQEMRRTYDFARREMKCPPVEAVALTGEGAVLRNLAQYLFVNLNIEVQLFNPLEGMTIEGGQKFPFEGHEFALAFGGAIAGTVEGSYRMDLTPAGYYRQLDRKRLTRQLAQTGVLLLVTLGLGAAALMRLDGIRQQELEAYAQANEEIRPDVESLKEKKTKLDIIKRSMEDKNSALNTLTVVADSASIPGKVTVFGIEYLKGQNVIVEANAKSGPDINTFVAELMQSGRFVDVLRPQDPTPSQQYNQSIFTFKLECPFIGGNLGEDEEGRD